MVQRNGMLGLVRFRMLRAGISKYSTLRLASSSSLCAASLAIPTRAMLYLRLLFAYWQGEFSRGKLQAGPDQFELIADVNVGEDPVVDLARRRGERCLAAPHLNLIVAEGEAKHEGQNEILFGERIVQDQYLGAARNRKLAQRFERAADRLMRLGYPGLAARLFAPVQGHQTGGDQQEQHRRVRGGAGRQQAVTGGNKSLRAEQVPSGEREIDGIETALRDQNDGQDPDQNQADGEQEVALAERARDGQKDGPEQDHAQSGEWDGAVEKVERIVQIGRASCRERV